MKNKTKKKVKIPHNYVQSYNSFAEKLDRFYNKIIFFLFCEIV